jgi:hypothetical protein
MDGLQPQPHHFLPAPAPATAHHHAAVAVDEAAAVLSWMRQHLQQVALSPPQLLSLSLLLLSLSLLLLLLALALQVSGHCCQGR